MISLDPAVVRGAIRLFAELGVHEAVVYWKCALPYIDEIWEDPEGSRVARMALDRYVASREMGA